MNKKIAIIIGLILVGSILIGVLIFDNGLGFEFNGVKISDEEYKSIQDTLLDEELVRVCNLENRNCIMIIPIT